MELKKAEEKFLNQVVSFKSMYGYKGLGIVASIECDIISDEASWAEIDCFDFYEGKDDYIIEDIHVDDLKLATHSQMIKALQQDIIDKSFTNLNFKEIDGEEIHVINYKQKRHFHIDIGCMSFTPKDINSLYTKLAKLFPEGEKVLK